MSMRRLFRFPWKAPRDVAAEVDEELAFHLDALTDDLIARGMTPEHARAEAGRRFGALDRARRALGRADGAYQRRRRRTAWLHALAQDARYGARQLRRNPGFTTIAVVTLALGVGANTLAFSVLYGSLFRHLPFAHPDQLVLLQVEQHRPDQSVQRFQWTYRQWRWIAEARLPLGVVGEYDGPVGINLSGTRGAERVQSEVVSPGYFKTLGITALAGRTFVADDNAAPGIRPVALIGYGLWLRRFGGDPHVLGQVIRGNGVPLVIVGVLPRGFRGVTGVADVWIPDMMAPQVSFDGYLTSTDTFHSVLARLAPGATLSALRAELEPLGPALAAADPTAETLEGATALRILARPLADVGIDPGRRRSAILLFGAVWLVLAVACVNLAALQLSRSRVRARELAVRAALGAGRGRLTRQLVTEGALLGLLGCACGIALASPGAALLRRLQPVRFPSWGNLYNAVSEFASIELSPQVLLFALAVSLATVVLVSVVPALRVSRPGLVRDLRQGTGSDGGAGWTLRRPGALAVFTVIELALALVLAVSAGLLVKSLARVQDRHFGFDPANVLTFYIDPHDPTYTQTNAPARITPLLEAVQRVPGVESASVSSCTPLSACGRHDVYVVGGDGRGTLVGVQYAAATHFRTLHIPVLQGRAFTTADRIGAPRVIIINQTGAQRLFPHEDPIGRRVVFDDTGSLSQPDSAWQIVGVVGDVTYWPVEGPPHADFYFPYRQRTYANTFVFVRTRLPASSIVPALRAAVAAVDPDLPLDGIATMERRMDRAFSGHRFLAYVLAGFAALAFGLAAVGVYGVASYSVSQRSREMGVRLALGAAPADVFRLVAREGAALGVLGLAGGLALALVVTRLLRASLYDVNVTDPLVFGTGVVIVGLATLLAVVVPAWRATRVDPLISLKAD
jgi:putative ABC transport system permease protein